MKAADRKVYQAVYERSLIMGDDGVEFAACEFIKEDGERCAHNGTRWRLEMAHINNKPRVTSMENVRYTCYKHHRETDHHERIVGGW